MSFGICYLFLIGNLNDIISKILNFFFHFRKKLIFFSDHTADPSTVLNIKRAVQYSVASVTLLEINT